MHNIGAENMIHQKIHAAKSRNKVDHFLKRVDLAQLSVYKAHECYNLYVP